MSVAAPPTTCPRSAAASARRTACAKAIASSRSGFGTVTIGAVEKYITDTAWERGWVKPLAPRARDGRIRRHHRRRPGGPGRRRGAAPQGLSRHVYDRHDRAGGLLIYGIPELQAGEGVVLRRRELLEEGGIVFQLNFEVGRDITLRRAARAPRRRVASPPASTRRARSRPRRRPARHRAGARLI